MGIPAAHDPRWGLCHPAMGSGTGSTASSDAFTLGGGGVHYIDLSAFARPFSFTLDRQDVQGRPAKVQAGVIYYEHGDTLTQRMGWLDPDSAAAWPWSLPDTVASKDLAALLLVMGTEGEPPTLTYTIAAPVAAMQDEPALAYTLEQNYPNPFHAGTTVRYALPRSGRVRLSVYDLLGREVAVVEDGIVAAGTHERRLDASKWASGIYHYRLATPVGSTSRQMVLVR